MAPDDRAALQRSQRPEKRPAFAIDRPKMTQSVLFRMGAGLGITGLLLFLAIIISAWQLNIYNDARREREATQAQVSFISRVQQDSTVLVLVTHRVANTKERFSHLAPEIERFPTDSILGPIAALRVNRDLLEEEAAKLPADDPIGRLLVGSVRYLDEIFQLAEQVAAYGQDGDWDSAKALVNEKESTSRTTRFEKLHTDLDSELRRAQILMQQNYVAVEARMQRASQTAITVTVLAVGTALLVGAVLGVGTIRSISNPISQLSEAATRLAEGEFEARVPVTQQDELGRLALAFNYMAGELQSIYATLEERAGTAEARLLQAIESIPDGFVLFDAEDRLVLSNQRYRERPAELAELIVPGARFEDLVRKAATLGYYQVAPLSLDEWVANRMERHRNPRGSFELQLSTGRWLRISEYRTQDGGIFGIRADVTERKQAERELREAKESAEARAEQLATLNRITQTVAAVYDLQPSLELVAAELLELFHAQECAIALLNEERSALTIVADHSRQAPESSAAGTVITLASNPLSAQVIRSGQPKIVSYSASEPATEGSYEGMIASGVRHFMMVPLRTHGDIIGTIGVTTDIADGSFSSTELELAETVAGQLAGAIENARLFNARNEFLASVSHEMRTPLVAVSGLTTLTQRRLEEHILPNVKADDPRTKRAMKQVVSNFEIILGEGRRLANLINNVLDSAVDQVSLHKEWVNLGEVVEAAMAGTSYLADRKQLELIIDLPEKPPEIMGDKDRLIQVVINLVSNAIKFTERGSVTCRVRQEGEAMVVSISDTGVGIAPRDRSRLFRKFSQVGEKHRGTGLGLSISKIIVESHGGRIWLEESQEGVGSTFSFTLPVSSGQEGAGAAGQRQRDAA